MLHYPSMSCLRNFTRNLDPINNENQPQNENEIKMINNFKIKQSSSNVFNDLHTEHS